MTRHAGPGLDTPAWTSAGPAPVGPGLTGPAGPSGPAGVIGIPDDIGIRSLEDWLAREEAAWLEDQRRWRPRPWMFIWALSTALGLWAVLWTVLWAILWLYGR